MLQTKRTLPSAICLFVAVAFRYVAEASPHYYETSSQEISSYDLFYNMTSYPAKKISWCSFFLRIWMMGFLWLGLLDRWKIFGESAHALRTILIFITMRDACVKAFSVIPTLKLVSP